MDGQLISIDRYLQHMLLADVQVSGQAGSACGSALSALQEQVRYFTVSLAASLAFFAW